MIRQLFAIPLLVALCAGSLSASETIWLEAEHLDGLKGYCWPMGRPDMKKTDGHWALSGPGWAAEWNQGGESGFLSIATAADDDRAVVTKSLDIPADGKYFVWVRYGDWREKPEPFEVRIEQAGSPAATGKYGETPVVEEDNETKLYFGWSFGWSNFETKLKNGPAKLSLVSTTKAPEPRQIDVIVLTTDASYRPRIKERPQHPSRALLDSYRQGKLAGLEPLARRKPQLDVPESWKPRTFKDKGFLYLWNVSPTDNWLSDDPNRVLFPYHLRDEDARKEFEQIYGGKQDVPIFSDPRIVPTFHGVGGGMFGTDPKTGEVLENGKKFARWLDANPNRQWGMMMNYHPGVKVGEKGIEQFTKYRDRFVGSISGEDLGYFNIDPKAMQAATAGLTTRRQVADAIGTLAKAANAEKYRKVYDRDIDKNPYEDVIACLSVGNIVFMPLSLEWGARTVGYESAAATAVMLPMRMAFMRGGARQHGSLTATYRSSNFGDSATIFSISQSYSSPKNMLDNYYSVFSGSGMTWYKFDIWYQYMAGSSMFYHEQGFDEYWKPGGTTAAGLKEVQLSPKGKLVDRFLRVTAKNPERGAAYTPVAILVDYAHGWEPSNYWPNSFKNYHQNPDKFRFGDHEKMLEEYFWTAYHPIAVEQEKPISGTNEVFLPGVFGDVFDVIFAYPDVTKWKTIDTYPVVVVAGEIELTAAEGQRLAQYVEKGGTLFVADAHLTGPGVKELKLPATGDVVEADSYQWMGNPEAQPSPRFRYRPISAVAGERKLATTAAGQTVCGAYERGAGRLIYATVPHGLTIGKQVSPIVPRLMAHLTRGVMPVEVQGDVEWLVNRTATGWSVTLMNPAGQIKPQQGILPTDYRENRPVKIQSHTPVTFAQDRLLPDQKLTVRENTVELEVPAGSVRIIDLR